MPVELLQRCVWLWRTGQLAWGNICWHSFKEQRAGAHEAARLIDIAINRADYCRAADLVEYEVLPSEKSKALAA